MTRILVTGSRDWECPKLAARILARLQASFPDLIIVHGHCLTGVDRSFRHHCEFHQIPDEPHPADWDAHGKSAGPKRNSEMVALGAKFCIACAKDLRASKGTKNCVELCFKAGIPVYLVDSDDAEPRRITEIPA